MKKLHFFFCMLLFSMASQAQQQEPVNTKTDRREFKGYTIRLVPATSGTYGYDILKGTERLIHQSCNPFTFSPRGLAKKEDAYKLAQWQIGQLTSQRGNISRQTPGAGASRKLQAQNKTVTMMKGRLSPEVAKQLQITILH